MKYVLIVGDGMSDRRIKELGGKTPLQAARKPNMDALARKGACGRFQSIPKGASCGSDIGQLTLLGYDVSKVYSGRAPLEAAAMGITLNDNDVAFRCNLVTIENGVMKDYSGGHVSSEEGKKAIAKLNAQLGKKGEIDFYPGVSYRNILVLRNNYSDQVSTTPPHDITGKKAGGFLPKPKNAEDEKAKKTSQLANELISSSQKILAGNTANSAWFWGQGKRPKLETFKAKYGKTGAVITAVDIVRGIGALAGLKIINVPGATGYLDTNYEGKADAAVEALKQFDFVFVHVEATDEASHEGKLAEKIKAIEALDARVIGRIMEKTRGQEVAIAVLPDHSTPLELKTHSGEPVPFVIYNPKLQPKPANAYDEEIKTEKVLEKDELMKLFLS
ncbi:cofactor-independent phosphoglycerate mutase [Candidatus Micrarchaeota archaeon]|nr:cofactor-independent phosphoglycerate mutase [Candidatus Micrarchaeota archaeon]